MLYTMFIYQKKSGLMLLQKNFNPELSNEKIELVSSLFSALQSFVKEIVSKGNQNIHTIAMGDLELKATDDEVTQTELITIADKTDKKDIDKFHIDMITIMRNHKQIFMDWDGDVSIFNFLQYETENLIKKSKISTSEKNIMNYRKDILDSIWGNLPPLDEKELNAFEEEKKYLVNKMKNTPSLTGKLEILQNIEIIVNKLHDSSAFEQIQQDRKKLIAQLEDAKEKIKYFLTKTKETLNKSTDELQRKSVNEVEFREVYLNLYSFATKLRLLGNIDMAEEYKKLALSLLEKSPEFQEKFSSIFEKILRTSEDICDYIPKPYCS